MNLLNNSTLVTYENQVHPATLQKKGGECHYYILKKRLTFRRVLEDASVIVRPGGDFEVHFAADGSLRVARHALQHAVVVLARLRDVQMPHSIVGQLVTSSLLIFEQKKIIFKDSKILKDAQNLSKMLDIPKFKIRFITYFPTSS